MALKEKIKDSKLLRKDNDERKAKLEELEELTLKKEEYSKKLQEFQKNDPKRYQDIITDSKQLECINELVKYI